ncbi:gamma-glutamyl-gamma-aminobutyrate hydrolase family protein [Catenuloplanes indicus]|uniref:Glutamine amidotransferase n=1 Tax=Catenuloplanes indicus TaxID=137267 RepID=A0AAE4B0Z4_9ACTN|nr:gamma-glutamyl-gamma-aminobutyrate hydrolase family protein [Catenuloplanes indicus]MDQ0369136.1 putative glutamine amidotransferase [Catenuloplanes indicus]
MRPIIGITGYREPASWGLWRDTAADLIPHTYVRAVTEAGGRAVLLPPDDGDAGVLRALDGLLLAGGADIGPGLYGEEPAAVTDSRPDRDAGEVALLTAALRTGLPILGVCRGMQLLAAVHGGRLHQHLPDVLGHEKHRPAPGVFGTHGLRCAAGSRIAALLGPEAEVNTYHHQGVADPGRLTATGWADDGLIEAVEDPAHPFLLGVQWHPEEAGDLRLFAALVNAAKA